jgi:hypothetical protein
MHVSHAAAAVDVAFDDLNLIADPELVRSHDAGHVPGHCQLCGLGGWDDRRVASGMRRLGDRRCAVL